jgi:hypothetical protein
MSSSRSSTSQQFLASRDEGRYDLDMRAILISTALLLALPITAAADDYPRLDVELGTTVSIDIGQRRGLICDDTSIITPDVQTRNGRNYFVVTGNTLGSTLCRVGTEPGQMNLFYDVHVVPPKKR